MLEPLSESEISLLVDGKGALCLAAYCERTGARMGAAVQAKRAALRRPDVARRLRQNNAAWGHAFDAWLRRGGR